MSRQQQWIAIRLPDLPCDALNLPHQDAPLVIVEQKQVIWMNGKAQQEGVSIGMNATRAQLLSNCELHPRNQAREGTLLHTLQGLLYSFTPHLELRQSPHIAQAGVLLEIASCLQLFGGFEAFIKKLQAFLVQQSLHTSLAVGHSSESAWVLSFCGDTNIQTSFCPIHIKEQLMGVPIQWLYDFPKEVSALEKMGFVTLGDIAKQIAAQQLASLRKRFGQVFTEYLSKLFGIDWDFQQPSLFTAPLTTYKPTDHFCESIQFDYPIRTTEQLYHPMEQLLKQLMKYLYRHQWQTKYIQWVLRDIYRNQDVLHVDADQPQSDWKLLFDLTSIQLENRELLFEIDTLDLICKNTQPLEAPSQALSFSGSRKSASSRDFLVTAARLKARLGDSSIFKLSYVSHHLPEKSQQAIGLSDNSYQAIPESLKTALRPTWLLKQPITIEQRERGLYWRGFLTLVRGPERIQGYWWHQPSARDYYLARRHDNLHIWIYQDLHTQNWFVQGIFG